MSVSVSHMGHQLRLRYVWLAALSTTCLCWLVGELRNTVPTGGDVPAYLLAARYGPLTENYDNPSHGWAFPYAIRSFSRIAGITAPDASARVITAISAGTFVLFGGLLIRCALPPYSAACGLLLLAVHPAVIDLGSKAMSDMLFAAMVGAAVWLLFLRDKERPARFTAFDLLAGCVAMLSVFVRGNSLRLILATPIALFTLGHGRAGRALIFLAGVTLSLFVVALLFRSEGLPIRSMFRSGAGEIAFATLDDTGTWLYRRNYEDDYPNYGTLFRKLGPRLFKPALKTLYYVQDWWLLVAFPVLGFFVIPGLLVWVRRLTSPMAAMTVCIVALQTTALWSGKFREARHLLAILPWLTTLAILGVSLLPRRVVLRAILPGRAIPIRSMAMAILTLASLGIGGRSILRNSLRPDPLAVAMAEAGDWLSTHAQPGDVLAATRLNIAYSAGIRPLDFVDVFNTEATASDQIVPSLRAKNCRWFAWIRDHSFREFPGLAWLNTGSPSGARLEYDTPQVRIWSIPRESPPNR